MSDRWPSLSVIIPTRERPEMVRRAISSALSQDYPADIFIYIVFDRSQPDRALEFNGHRRRVLVTANERTPGLAGARNTGIFLAQTELVAFLDDDDVWLPGKLRHQLRLLRTNDSLGVVTTAINVVFDGKRHPRLANRSRVTLADLVLSRMSMLHSSSILFRREFKPAQSGIDESMPNSMAEDWDFLLRSARVSPIGHVDVPLVDVTWGQASFFANAWRDKIAAARWLLDHHPEFAAEPRALAAMQGRIAFGNAVIGKRREAIRTARSSMSANWHEPRAYLALLVSAGVPADWIFSQLNKRGRGI